MGLPQLAFQGCMKAEGKRHARRWGAGNASRGRMNVGKTYTQQDNIEFDAPPPSPPRSPAAITTRILEAPSRVAAAIATSSFPLIRHPILT